MSRLPDVCDLQYGFAFNADLFTTDVSKGMPLVRIRDVVRGFSETYTLEPFPENYLVHDGDILIGMDGEFNIARWHGGTAALNQRVCKLTPHENIHDQYLLYFLPKALKRIEDATPFVTVKHLSAKKLNAIEIPDVPMAVQKKMAAKMDEISAAMANRKKVIAWLKKIVQARFVEMFGDLAFNPYCWKSAMISEVCKNPDDIKCGPFGTQLGKDEYVSDGVPVWEIPQINKQFQVPAVDFITLEKAQQLNAYSLRAGDIAMSRKGNVGKCAIYPDDYPDGIIHSDVLRIRVNHEICEPHFLMCQLHFSRAICTQIECISMGAIMAGINVSKLKHLKICVPPLSLQQKFAAFVRQTDAARHAAEAQLATLATLRAKVLQDAFGA